jgi:MoaA/NifB/PqqE/SkfB family radical SAM enzyme
MTDEHLERLLIFLGKWGVKAVCFGGGGEPTLHPFLDQALYICKGLGMEASVATNGTLFTQSLITSMAQNCRWVGVSVDAATGRTYEKGRKAKMFDRAIMNISRLVVEAKDTKCDVGFKFLIFNYNQGEIYEACKIAKSLGVRDFHARPADWSHQGMGEIANKIGGYDTGMVREQFDKCHELEDDNFRVFTVVHKFDTNMKPRKDFEMCGAAPCCIQLCADGNTYFCPDQRFQPDYMLGSHNPPENILNFWGGPRHKSLTFNTGKSNCTTRCTFCSYNRQCEELFLKDNDPMCKHFI